MGILWIARNSKIDFLFAVCFKYHLSHTQKHFTLKQIRFNIFVCEMWMWYIRLIMLFHTNVIHIMYESNVCNALWVELIKKHQKMCLLILNACLQQISTILQYYVWVRLKKTLINVHCTMHIDNTLWKKATRCDCTAIAIFRSTSKM